jgi:hypothetical protein
MHEGSPGQQQQAVCLFSTSSNPSLQLLELQTFFGCMFIALHCGSVGCRQQHYTEPSSHTLFPGLNLSRFNEGSNGFEDLLCNLLWGYAEDHPAEDPEDLWWPVRQQRRQEKASIFAVACVHTHAGRRAFGVLGKANAPCAQRVKLSARRANSLACKGCTSPRLPMSTATHQSVPIRHIQDRKSVGTKSWQL